MNISDIYSGWKNHLLPKESEKDLIENTSSYRMKICEGCPHISSNHHTPLRPDLHCTLCGCTLVAKTKALNTSCPDNPPRWGSIIKQEDGRKEKNEGT